MAVDTVLLNRYISELYSVTSLEQRFQVYEKYLLELGFSGATYTCAPRIQWEAMPTLPAIFMHTKDYPAAFLIDYEKGRFDQKDFTVRRIVQEAKTAPMDWREYEQSGSLSEDEISLIHYAREHYNIQNAISIPTMLEERGAAGASIISYEENVTFREITAKNLDNLIRITRLFHDSNVSDLGKFILPIFESLTAKEIAILNYKASGKPMKTIEDHTGLDPSYSSNVLSKLRKRLGNVNNDRLMYLFGLLNSLKDIPK